LIEKYRRTALRIRQELAALERVAARAERAIELAQERLEDQDFYLDSAALNLHDFYTGVERAFHQIAAAVDEIVPSGHDWHRELLRQMADEQPGVRPAVISTETHETLEEYLRFRHVVRNLYAFEVDSERLGRLVAGLRPVFHQVRKELDAFVDFLEQIAGSGEEKGQEER
jgi:hypothetical protein